MHKEKEMEILKKIKMINILSPLNNNSKCLKNNFHQRYQLALSGFVQKNLDHQILPLHGFVPWERGVPTSKRGRD
uniref:Uncharacterized protein n=1 Tax=Populus trichocarpa TaxID=3694 RepID=A0A2K1ZH57_POPTR